MKTRKILLNVLWFTLLVNSNCAFSLLGDSGNLVIARHKTHNLRIDSIARVAIGDGSIVDAHLVENGNAILIIGKNAGETDIRIWQKNGNENLFQLIVTEHDNETTFDEITNLIKEIPGIKVSKTPQNVLLSGMLTNQHEKELFAAVLQRFPYIINHVQVNAVDLQPMVLVDVKIIEMKKNAIQELGVKWSDAVNGPYGVASKVLQGSASALSNSLLLAVDTEITSVLQLLETSGQARLLAKPQLSAKSGSKAEFLAGGEVPIPIQGVDDEISVEFKKYGVILNIEPVADQFGYIEAHVEVEVSTVDPSVTSMGLPGFLTRKTNTVMNMQSGQTMVISGLLNHEQSKFVDKLPLFGNVPILGELFKSRGFRDNETELVIFVTPQVKMPNKNQSDTAVKRAHEMEKQFNAPFRMSILD